MEIVIVITCIVFGIIVGRWVVPYLGGEISVLHEKLDALHAKADAELAALRKEIDAAHKKIDELIAVIKGAL